MDYGDDDYCCCEVDVIQNKVTQGMIEYINIYNKINLSFIEESRSEILNFYLMMLFKRCCKYKVYYFIRHKILFMMLYDGRVIMMMMLIGFSIKFCKCIHFIHRY